MKIFAGKEPNQASTVVPKTAQFHMAHFLKLNGAVWSGKGDENRLDLPDTRPMLHVSLIGTRSEAATFVDYK